MPTHRTNLRLCFPSRRSATFAPVGAIFRPGSFVDEPRKVVEVMPITWVASLMKKLAEGFANERERLEKQWDRGAQCVDRRLCESL